MDPNAALEAIRNIITQHYGGIARTSDYEELADLIAGLDNWMSVGGFMPSPWQESRPQHWQEVLASTNAKAYEAGLKASSHE